MEGSRAGRGAPNPSTALVRLGLLAVLTLCVFVVLGIQELHTRGQGSHGWELIAIGSVVAAVSIGMAVRDRRREEGRAERIYGSGWRSLSKPERMELWLQHQSKPSTPHRPNFPPLPPVTPLLPPSDPKNPYSAPIL
jgi:hypothetical protein